MSRTWALAKAVLLLLVLLIAAAVGTVWIQGRRTPQGRPDYVALGSSFAAGAGLGTRQSGSPTLCDRTLNGYPQQLARMRHLAIVDMSCSGAVTRHILQGGQFLQGPQLRAITGDTLLVTITVGGNDIGYVADMLMLATRHSHGPLGWLASTFWKGPKAPAERGYARLDTELSETIRAVHGQAPAAAVVLATYPAVLPPAGTCPRLGLTAAETALMRRAAEQLAAISRSVAARNGALLVDMNRLGEAHNACSAQPWTNGWNDVAGIAFHPTVAGAMATAAAISQALDTREPATVNR